MPARRSFAHTVLELAQGDITRQETDAIVNAANSSLLGGGGVDGAIHRAGGPAILEDCKKIRAARGELPPGEAVITTGGRLKARFVIHTVGPVYGASGDDAALLARCHEASLALAVASGVRSIAFPAISTGAYGYPVGEAARVSLTAVRTFLERDPPIDLVRFVLSGEDAYRAFESALSRVAPVDGTRS